MPAKRGSDECWTCTMFCCQQVDQHDKVQHNHEGIGRGRTGGDLPFRSNKRHTFAFVKFPLLRQVNQMVCFNFLKQGKINSPKSFNHSNVQRHDEDHCPCHKTTNHNMGARFISTALCWELRDIRVIFLCHPQGHHRKTTLFLYMD